MSFSEFTPDDYAVIAREYDDLRQAAAGRCADEDELAGALVQFFGSRLGALQTGDGRGSPLRILQRCKLTAERQRQVLGDRANVE